VEERWRKPCVPLKIEPVDLAVSLVDGRVFRDYRMVFAKEDIERMRAGYVCVKCLEPHEHAWPERCSICGSPMRDEQARFFAAWFDPEEEVIQVSRDWEAEFAGLEERRRKEEER
jgi:hypothetical protein